MTENVSRDSTANPSKDARPSRGRDRRKAAHRSSSTDTDIEAPTRNGVSA